MMKDLKKITALAIILLCVSPLSAMVDGSLDASFNGCGLSALLDADSTIKAMAIQLDGKIVAGGYSNVQGKPAFLIARYNIDGSLDRSFGSSGYVITKFGAGESESCANALVIQHDGKIVAAGFTNAVRNSSRWCLARYNPDGSLDESFFGGRAIFKGTVITFFGNDSLSQAHALALAPDGKIVVAGISHVTSEKTYFALARYTDDGSLDATFNPEGKGAPIGLVRTTFGDESKDDEAFAVALQPNGKIVAGGFSMITGAKTFALARYQPDGSLDKSFFAPGFAHHNGTVVTNFACGESEGAIHALVIQADGKIVAAGSTNSNSPSNDISHFALARYDSRGILDSSFGGYGLATVPGTIISNFGSHAGTSRIHALALQGDGKILAGGTVFMNGTSHFALARYTSDGCLDIDFNDGISVSGKVITSLGGRKANGIFALGLQSNGDIVAAGSTDMNGRPQAIVARYLSSDVLLEPEIFSPLNNSVIVNGSAVQISGLSQNPAILKIFVDENLVGSIATKGVQNTWNYQLPPLTSGTHTIKVLELNAGSRSSLLSQPYTIVIDQHPKPVDASVTTCGLNPVSGYLKATGSSGFYSFALDSVIDGSVDLNGSHFVFKPSIPAGQASFNFRVTDTITQCSAIGTVRVTINEVPAATSAEITTFQNTAINGSVARNVSGGNPPFSFSQVGTSADGTVIFNNDGSFTFVPHDGFHGTASFQYQITDSKGSVSEPQIMYITVYELPKALDGSFTTHEAESLSNSLSNLVSGGTAPYSFNLINSPRNCALTLEQNGYFTLIPTLGFNGVAEFTYQVTDAHQSTSNSASITITVFESPVAAHATMSICQNGQLSGSLSNLVNKGTAPYIYSQVGTAVNGVAVITDDGSLSFTPNADFAGTASFNYQVVDANNSVSNAGTITVIVNELPTVADVALATCQDIILNGTLASAVSGGLPPYSFALTNAPSNGSITLNQDGSFQYIPEQGFYGTSNFQFSVIDSNGCSSLSAQAIISVWENPSAQSSALETCANRSVNVSISQLVTGGLEPYSFIIEHVENGTVSLNADGSYSFIPVKDFSGIATIAYHAVDAHQCTSNSATIALTIYPSPAVASTLLSTITNAPISGSLASLATGGIAPYLFSLVGQPKNASVLLDSDGNYEFTPLADYFGGASFNFHVTDIHGCVSNSAAARVSVFPLPQVSNDTIVSFVNNQIVGSLADRITVGAPPFIFEQLTAPTNGSLTISKDGLYIYNPNKDFVGHDSFAYIVRDTHKGVSNSATISFNIYNPLEINDQQVYAACQDAAISGDLTSGISGSVAPYAFTLISQAINGSVILNADGSFTYTPSTGYFGADSFSYEVTDSLGLSKAYGIVQCTLYEKPRVQHKIFTLLENQVLDDSLAGLATAGQPPYSFSCIDNSSLNGSLLLDSDGTFNFIAKPGFSGTTSFTYTAVDANNCSSTAATIVIHVFELPIASDARIVAITDIPFASSLVSQISAGAAPYTFQIVTDPRNGTVSLNADGSYTYISNPDYSGNDSFAYSVVDANQGISNVATITVTVYKSVAITQAKEYASCPNASILGTLQDVVVDGRPPYTFSLVNGASNGALEFNADGSFSYTPALGYFGSDSFQYLVHDSLPTQTQGTVAFTIFEPPSVLDKTWTIFESEIVQDSVSALISGGKQPYTIISVGNPTNGTLELNTDGSFNFAPSNGYIGKANFQYMVTDVDGCASRIATATIQILQLPKAQNADVVMVSNSAFAGSLTALVSGGTPPYNFQKLTDPVNGNLVVNADGSYTYSPNSEYIGNDTFSYSVTDGNNGNATAHVNIGIATSPVIAPIETYQTCENTALLAHLISAVSGGVPPYQFGLAQNANNGKVTITGDGSFTYEPAHGFGGNDAFQFSVTDAIGTRVNGLVPIMVNQSPTAQDKTLQIQTSEFTDTLEPLVSGGNPPYTFAQVGSATNAKILIHADGTFNYISTIEGISVANFAYQVMDANNCVSNTAKVTINCNLPPTARNSNFSTLQDQPLSNSLEPLIFGGNGPYIFGRVGSPRNGSLVLRRNGSFIFTPNPGFVGNAGFEFMVTDKNGISSAVVSVSIIVNEDANKRFKKIQQHNAFKKYLNERNK